ncbi:MAG TPA: aminopeptidase P family N-terminal domain-containing protein, partial [Candidatus Nitrosocosmicus sp.]|nr:aminopeptidase P family N-terminal domain-containing protein [Candidatus Nitrosocosmicus sp.]
MNFTQRLTNIKKHLKSKNLDALLVSNFYNILYITGFKPLSPEEREGWLFITPKICYLFTDGRYYEQFTNYELR